MTESKQRQNEQGTQTSNDALAQQIAIEREYVSMLYTRLDQLRAENESKLKGVRRNQSLWVSKTMYWMLLFLKAMMLCMVRARFLRR